MSIHGHIKDILILKNSLSSQLKHNRDVGDILEGDLLPFIEADLRKQLGPQSFEQIRHRIAPINVLKKIIDKLSRIYQQNPARVIIDGNDADIDLQQFYEKSMCFDKIMNNGNEFFNTYKYALYQPFLDRGIPKLRAIPNDRFFVYSANKVDPTQPTHYVLIDGTDEKKDIQGVTRKVDILHIWTDDEFVIINSDGEVKHDIMHRDFPELINENGTLTNPFGRVPFVYVNQSHNRLIPKVDTDTFQMTKLIAVLLADLNYAVMFQSFAIIYGINVDTKNMKMAPNAIWNIQPVNDEMPASLNTIKPEVNITEVLGLIQGQLAFWMQTKGIRPGSMGQLSAENFASGISKMVDEMDTAEVRQRQVGLFKVAEEQLWDLILHSMHPYWVGQGLIENHTIFSSKALVEVTFHEQLPLIQRGELAKDLKIEVDAGLISKKSAIQKLNPAWSADRVEDELKSIDQERGLSIEQAPTNPTEAQA